MFLHRVHGEEEEADFSDPNVPMRGLETPPALKVEDLKFLMIGLLVQRSGVERIIPAVESAGISLQRDQVLSERVIRVALEHGCQKFARAFRVAEAKLGLRLQK